MPDASDSPRDPFLSLKVSVVAEQRELIEASQGLTLADLRQRIAEAVRQCREIVLNGDPLVAESDGVPEPLASELRHWPASDPTSEKVRFSDRGGELAAFAWRLDVLEDAIGGDVPVFTVLKDADGGTPSAV